MEDGVVELGGRRFMRLAQSTVEHDFWLMAKIRKAGLDEIEVEEGMDPDTLVSSIITKSLDSGLTMVLLGGLLVPEGTAPQDWTPAMAAEVTAHISKLVDHADKAKISPLAASMLIGFFQSGLSSLLISKSSSEVSVEEGPEADTP